jgi:hypothetical protein
MLKFQVNLANVQNRAISQCVSLVNNQRGTFGIEVVLSIVAVLVVGAFIFIPGLRTFADGILDAMDSWWTTTIRPRVFPTT